MAVLTPEQRLRRERELFAKCLQLARCDDPTPLLTEALELLRELTGASRGYVEVEDTGSGGALRWAVSTGVDADARRVIEGQISRGVVAAAIESGETIHTASALLDERFRERESVREASIEAVLCVPLRAHGVVGVVYLQNRGGGGEFDEQDVSCVETIARFVSSLSEHLLELVRRRQAEDKTASVRARLRADAIIGTSAALAAVLERLEVVARMDANVLLTGPNGTGKSMLARVLHDSSPRARGPFVELNCAALPENLVESELFGAERGAFSGLGPRGLEGKVAAANGGTLFLDEIGELPLTVQAKLLQLVQEKQFLRLGGNRPVRVDVRVVTATNRDLARAAEDRTFREDLYFRIRGVALDVPALAARREDITVLARHFVAHCCARNGFAPMTLSPGALSALELAEWPGNIRQLAAVCEEAVVNAQIARRTEIERGHVFPAHASASAEAPTFHGARADWERAFLARALESRDWNVAATAKELDLSRAHLHELIRKHGLVRG